MNESPASAHIPVGLATAAVYPDSATTAFETAARLGYDGVEIMVWTDPVSQDVEALRRLTDHYAMPVLAVHAPCLLITQRVWGRDPWAKLQRSAQAAAALGARVVVVHPPFLWQRDYARGFVAGIRRLSEETGVTFAVENMFPWRAGSRELPAYAPTWNPVAEDYSAVTLDLSHTAVSGSDGLGMAQALGRRLAHVHLADGSGSSRDEHLVPGRGTQPCAEVLQHVRNAGLSGAVVLEVNTRRTTSRDGRDKDLAESLEFARRHLGQSGEVPRPRNEDVRDIISNQDSIDGKPGLDDPATRNSIS